MSKLIKMSKVTIEIDIQVPTVPNFLSVRDQKEPISIADLKDDQLIIIANRWKESLLKRAQVIRDQRLIDKK